MMSRGVVACPSVITYENNIPCSRSLSAEEIRYYALYWDKIVIPDGDTVIHGIIDEKELIYNGLLNRPYVTVAKDAYKFIHFSLVPGLVQSILTEQLSKKDNAINWVMHQIGSDLIIPPEFLEDKRKLRFDLVNALPVPTGDVSIEKIVNFKNKRKDELNYFHENIENLYLEALKNPDSEIGNSKAIRELAKGIKNINKTTSEAWTRTKKFNFVAEFNLDLKKIALGVASGSTFAFFSDMISVNLAQLLAGVLGCIKIKASYSQGFKSAGQDKNLAFLSEAYNESIIK